MSENLKGLTGINIAWKVIRDLMNIAFIFLLIYESIKLIIGQSSTDKIKKFITGIVLASILINFSLFFTKLLIDASNIVTVGFYNSILGEEDASANYGLSNPMIKALGLTNIWDGNVVTTFSAGGNNDSYKIMVLGIGGSILFLITSFCFLAISVMFVIRYVVLLVLLMLSPIAYMGMALSEMDTYAKQWWETLKGQLLFGPMYMLMTWVILTLMSSPSFITTTGGAGSTGGYAAALTDSASAASSSAIGILFNFAVIIGLMITSIVMAKSTASKGSSLIGQATGKLTTFAGGALMGGAARAGRATLGRYGNMKANDEKLKERAAAGDRGARIQLAAANRFAKSSFDVRATEKFGDLGKATGVDFGKVNSTKENFRAIRKEEEEKAVEKAKQYKPSDATYENAKAEDKKFDDVNKAKLTKTKSESDEAKEKHDEVDKELQKIEKEIEKKEKEQDRAISNERKAEIQNEIDALKKESTDKKTSLVALKTLMDDKKKAFDDATKEKESYHSEEKQLNEDYERRVSSVADRIGHQKENDTAINQVWRKVANTVGTAANVLGIPGVSLPKTKTDREAIARKMRAGAKEKSKKEKAADANAALAKEEAENKAKEEAGGTTTPPPPASPPTPPPPAPTP